MNSELPNSEESRSCETSYSHKELLILAEKTVAQCQEELPEELRKKAQHLPVILEKAPNHRQRDGSEEKDLLGLFCGIPYQDEPGDTPTPPSVHLFLENLWDFCGEDERTFSEEVRITYLHELGHYLGLEEKELQSRGLE